jgi:hypothetical protein
MLGCALFCCPELSEFVEEVSPLLVVNVVGVIVGRNVGGRAVIVTVGDLVGKLVVGIGIGEVVGSGVGFLLG